MRARLVWSAKIAVTVGLFAWVISGMDGRGLLRALSEIGPLSMAAVLLLTAASILSSAFRWKRVLGYLGEHVRMGALIGDTLVGTTYNMLLPTTAGGDVLRSLRCEKRVETRAHAWASVVYERVMGLGCLALFSAVGLLVGATGGTFDLWIASVVVAAVFALMLLAAHAPLRFLARLARPRLEPVAGGLDRMADAFAGPLARPLPRLETFGWSVVYQAVALSILVAAGHGWGEPNLVVAVYAGVPIALVASMVPITIAGLGLRESLFVAVLAQMGFPPERSLALAFVWLGSNLACAFAGAAVMASERS